MEAFFRDIIVSSSIGRVFGFSVMTCVCMRG